MQNRHKTIEIDFSGVHIKLSSNFDSGNMENAKVFEKKIIITPALDPVNHQYALKQSSKTFFHFSIKSDQQTALPIVVERMKILEYFSTEDQFQQLYRICVYRRKKDERKSQQPLYQKIIMENMKRVQIENNYQLHFKLFVEQEEQVFLAYHYPYSYQRCISFLQTIQEQIKNINIKLSTNRTIYYKKQLIIQSLERRSIQLITLTEHSLALNETESRISKSLFPFYEIEDRPLKFNKPYIMFTCRVHSGQTSASFALEGIIQFLLSNNPKANFLLKNFVFLFVPMLNPDGVFHGTYRMDTMGHNLNRFYNNAQSHRQPAIFAIQNLILSYANRLVFFMDMHSHPHPNKGSFIYGNSFQQIEQQVESQLYARILSKISQCFGYQWSSFSQNQMASRDLNQLLTKEGCARVQVYKTLGVVFSYTMQMGYHGCAIKNKIDEDFNFKSSYRRNSKVFLIEDYKQHGKSILLSLAQLFIVNINQNFVNSSFKGYQFDRENEYRQILQKQDRFRQMDSFIFKKMKSIQQTALNQIYQPLFRRFLFLQSEIGSDSRYARQFFILEKTNQSEKSKDKPIGCETIKNKKEERKNEIVFNIKNISKTLDHYNSNQKYIPSYKSSVEARGRPDTERKLSYTKEDPINSIRFEKYRFAKLLNLNFNPFPPTEHKKIYNVIGNRKASLRFNIIDQIQQNRQNQSQINTIDFISQMQFGSVRANDLKDHRGQEYQKGYISNKKIIKKSDYLDQYQDDRLEQRVDPYSSQKNENQQDRFILPKIIKKYDKPEHFGSNYKVELQYQRQYDKEYNIKQKNLVPVHTKALLRNNNLKMKSLLKTNK